MKWRFLDESQAGLAVSIYPQLELNVSSSSVDKGLVDRPARLLLPISAVRTIGPVAMNLEIGGEFRSGEAARLVWGAALGHELGASLEGLTEVFGTTGSDLDARQALVDIGLRWKILERSTILFSVGRSSLNGNGGGRPTERLFRSAAQLRDGDERTGMSVTRGSGRRRP